MKIVLLKDVSSYGKEGDIIEVSDGYARNFLFPQNLAVPATAQAVDAAETKKKTIIKGKKKEIKEAGRLASALDGLEIIVSSKATPEGKLYAAVSAKEVAEAIKKENIKIDPAWVEFSLPIKETGSYEVVINLPHGFEARLNLAVEIK